MQTSATTRVPALVSDSLASAAGSAPTIEQQQQQQQQQQQPPPPPPRCEASITYRLAHETSLLLERTGEFVLASEVLGRALCEEAQRVNQSALHSLDLTAPGGPEGSRAVHHAMIHQRNLAKQLRAPLRERARRSDGSLLRCLGIESNEVPRPSAPPARLCAHATPLCRARRCPRPRVRSVRWHRAGTSPSIAHAHSGRISSARAADRTCSPSLERKRRCSSPRLPVCTSPSGR